MEGVEARLVGRERELAELESFLAQIEHGGAVVLEGAPGIGKTTLWREALRLAEASGVLALPVRPAEAEAKLSYAGLADLLRPLPADAFATLPPLQREALDVALLRANVGNAPAEPFAVAAGAQAAACSTARSPAATRTPATRSRSRRCPGRATARSP